VRGSRVSTGVIFRPENSGRAGRPMEGRLMEGRLMEGRPMEGSCRPPPSLTSVSAGLGGLGPPWKTCRCQHNDQPTPQTLHCRIADKTIDDSR
jgi:hypothetical protein